MSVTRVDFFVLDGAQSKNDWLSACQIIEKIYENHQSIYIHVNSENEATRLDELLWTYKDISFLPHEIIKTESKTNIAIGYDHAKIPAKSLLINFADRIPEALQQFQRIVEFVFPESAMQQLAREHFKQYRALGFEMNTIKYKTV